MLLDSSLIDGYSTPAAKVSLDFGLEVDQCTFLEGNVSVLPPVYVIGPLGQCALQYPSSTVFTREYQYDQYYFFFSSIFLLN